METFFSWEILMFYKLFLSSQLKQCVIITCKNGIDELPHELPNDLILKDLGKLGSTR